MPGREGPDSDADLTQEYQRMPAEEHVLSDSEFDRLVPPSGDHLDSGIEEIDEGLSAPPVLSDAERLEIVEQQVTECMERIAVLEEQNHLLAAALFGGEYVEELAAKILGVGEPQKEERATTTPVRKSTDPPETAQIRTIYRMYDGLPDDQEPQQVIADRIHKRWAERLAQRIK
jgi:hypothetical protein